MEGKVSSESVLAESRKQSFRGALDQLRGAANSIFSFALLWEDIENHFKSTNNAIEARAEELREKENSINVLFQQLENQKAELAKTEEEKEYDGVFEKLKLKEKEVEEQQKRLELKEMEYEKKLEELEGSKKEVEKQRNEFELKEMQCNKKLEELDRLKQSVSEALRLKEKELEKQKKGVELKIKQDHVEKQLELKDKYLNERFRVLRSNEMEIEKRTEELELKEKQVEKWFRVSLDGNALQIFLNEREKDLESLRIEVAFALRLSSDPAKLVLDAMRGFYPPHLKKGEMEFKEDVVRRSCIVLSEQLRKISPEIKPHVKKEATELAFDWKRKMRADTKHSVEVLGFLQLLAAYGLASEFDADDLLHYIEMVAQDGHAPELFRILGLEVHISSFIENLISKEKRIEAIYFVYAFDLVSEFPPVPLLKDFLHSSKIAWKKMKRKLIDFHKIEGANRRLQDVKAALRCIQDLSIVSGFSPKVLENLTYDLEKQIAEMKTKMLMSICGVPSTHLNVKTESSLNAAVAITSDCASKSVLSANPKVQSTVAVCSAIKPLWYQQTGIKRPHSATLEDSALPSAGIASQNPAGSSGNEGHPEQIRGESSDLLPSEHGILDSLHNENSNAHQLALKPAEYALDAIKRFCSLEWKDDKSIGIGISEEMCISLLEKVSEIAPLFDPHVKEEALKFAADWKARLMEKRHGQSEVALFVEFLAAYGLTCSFPANDLLSLLDCNYGRKTASDLCETLGLADNIPDFIETLIQRNQRIEAAKYVHVLGMNDKFPIIRLLCDHWDYSKTIGQRLCEEYNNSITLQIEAIREEIDALRAIINCFEAYNLQPEGQMSPDNLEVRILQLEKRIAEKEVELDKAMPCARSKSISLQKQKKNGLPSTTTSHTQPQKQAQYKRRKTAVSSGPSFLPNHIIVPHPAQFLDWPTGYYFPWYGSWRP